MPAVLSSGEAYSSTTGCGASARAVTASFANRPSSHSSTRAQTTSAFVISDRLDRPPEELALAALTLDETDGGTRQRDGEREAREAGAGTQVGDGAGGAQRVYLQRRDGIREVDIRRQVAVAHRCRGVLIGLQGAQQRPHLRDLPLIHPARQKRGEVDRHPPWAAKKSA